MSVLASELATDPLTRGYSGMTDQQAADDLNTAYRTGARDIISASELWNAFDPTEYDALVAANKEIADLVSGMGDAVPIGSGHIKNKLFAMFTAGTTSRDNLIALAAPAITRAQELGIPFVKVGHVEAARA